MSCDPSLGARADSSGSVTADSGQGQPGACFILLLASPPSGASKPGNVAGNRCCGEGRLDVSLINGSVWGRSHTAQGAGGDRYPMPPAN